MLKDTRPDYRFGVVGKTRWKELEMLQNWYKVVGTIPGVAIPPPFVHNADLAPETLNALLDTWDGNWIDLGGGVRTISAEDIYNRGVKGLSRLVKRKKAKEIIEAVAQMLKARPYGLPDKFPNRVGSEEVEYGGDSRGKRGPKAKKQKVGHRNTRRRKRNKTE